MDKPPQTPKKETTRDQRLQIQIYRESGQYTYLDIAKRLHITPRQVQYACFHRITPQKHHSGCKPVLNEFQINEIITYISQSKKHRRMTLLEVSTILEYHVGPGAIEHALKKYGYHRRIARRKPPISEKNRGIRLIWAKEHINWTSEQWARILWTDETWVTGGQHTRTWVTRKAGEEFDPTCIVEKLQRRSGWMFWGCFSGLHGKGPGLFWEKDWGSINKDTYCAHTVPIIHGWIRMHPELILMQDNAPGHAASFTRQEFCSRGVEMIFWPAFSPDLNPIETVWNIMKDYIQANYEEKLSYDRLKKAVKEAWEVIEDKTLIELLSSMHERCTAVIAANGMHTKF